MYIPPSRCLVSWRCVLGSAALGDENGPFAAQDSSAPKHAGCRRYSAAHPAVRTPLNPYSIRRLCPRRAWGPDPPSAHKEANYLAHVVRREGHPRSPPCRAPDHKSEAKASATVVARRGARIFRFISPQPSSAWTKVDPLGLPRTEEDEPASRCRLSVCPLPSYGTHLRRSGK